MQLDITNIDLQTLLVLYRQEMDTLKEKLLSGESWENLKPVRRNITELAITIRRSHGYNVSDGMAPGGPDSYPGPGRTGE